MTSCHACPGGCDDDGGGGGGSKKQGNAAGEIGIVLIVL